MAQTQTKLIYGTTPLDLASIKGHTAIAELLLNNSADPNKEGKYECTPLFLVSIWGYTAMAALLLYNGADPNKANEYGITPLYQASWKGHTATVELLLKHAANKFLENNHKETPLMIAQENEKLEVIELLQNYPQVLPLQQLCLNCICQNRIETNAIPETLLGSSTVSIQTIISNDTKAIKQQSVLNAQQ